MNYKFKKIIFLFCIFTIFFNSYICYADDFIEEIENSDFLETTTELSKEPTLNSKNIIAIDRKTSTILFEKNAYKKVPMASTTKIMTCIIALENSNLNDIVTISKKASSVTGSTLGINENDKISMNDLLYGLMLRSGNDCAVAIAEYVSGTIENFANLMNTKAQELNLIDTHFVTPHGLDNDNHYTTAYELALLTNYALTNKSFRTIVSSKTYTINLNGYPRILFSTNELLGNLNGVYGVKTGFTFKAGRCLVSSCKRGDLDIIVVVLGADTKNQRTSDSRNLINYIFKNFKYYDTYPILEKNFNEYLNYFNKNIILQKTTEMPNIVLSKENNYSYPLTQNDILNLSTKIYTLTTFSSKIKKNTKIGYITIYSNEKIIYSLDILLENELTNNSWKFYFKNILNRSFNFLNNNNKYLNFIFCSQK